MTETGELVARARRGNRAAYEALVRRYYRAAFATALALVGNGMDAEDVVQDAFIRALERLDELRQPERFPAWLTQIVRNRAHNVREYEHLRDGIPLQVANRPAPANPARDADRAEMRDLLEQALRTLTGAQRQVVLMHDLEGWKHKEIADVMGISEVMARQHLFVARKLLREQLGELWKEYANG